MKRILFLLSILLILGISAVSAQNTVEAQDAFERAHSLFKQKQDSEAIPYFNTTISEWKKWLNNTSPSSDNYNTIKQAISESYFNIGQCNSNLRQYDQAVAAYMQSIEYNPANIGSYRGLGNAYENLRRYDLAEEAYKNAIRIDPNDGVAYARLGVIYYSYGEDNEENFNASLYFYEKALSLASSFSNSSYDNVNLSVAKTFVGILREKGYSSSRANPAAIAIPASTGVARSTATTSGSGTAASASFDWRARIVGILKKIGWEAGGNLATGGAFRNNSSKTINLYRWTGGTIYMGASYNGYPQGSGLIIAAPGEYVEEWPGCSVFAGTFNEGVAIGGIGYDKAGKLLYGGMNLDGKGLEKVQPIGDAARKTFGVITYPANDDRRREFYIGENIGGKRHGYGMLKWNSGSVWIGEWSNDKQNGVGIRIYDDGTSRIEEWKDGEFVKEL